MFMLLQEAGDGDGEGYEDISSGEDNLSDFGVEMPAHPAVGTPVSTPT